jgi:preprotein translocase subunit Sec63
MYTIILISITICYLLLISYLHYRVMQLCAQNEAMPDTKHVLGIITDTRPANLINRDLK